GTGRSSGCGTGRDVERGRSRDDRDEPRPLGAALPRRRLCRPNPPYGPARGMGAHAPARPGARRRVRRGTQCALSRVDRPARRRARHLADRARARAARCRRARPRHPLDRGGSDARCGRGAPRRAVRSDRPRALRAPRDPRAALAAARARRGAALRAARRFGRRRRRRAQARRVPHASERTLARRPRARPGRPGPLLPGRRRDRPGRAPGRARPRRVVPRRRPRLPLPPPARRSETPDERLLEELAARGATIGRIEIVVQNVFDTSNPEEAKRLYRWANKVHMTTRKSVIESVLLFDEGDRLEPRLLAESARLLRARDFLVEATVEPSAYHEKTNTVDILVVARDGWSLSPEIKIGRNGGENEFGLGVEESNLLGIGKGLTVSYTTD